jgi:hypothetical protein
VGKGGEPITFWKEGGELRAVRMISKDEGLALYESLNTLPKQLSDVALNFLAMSQTALRAGVTSNRSLPSLTISGISWRFRS